MIEEAGFENGECCSVYGLTHRNKAVWLYGSMPSTELKQMEQRDLPSLSEDGPLRVCQQYLWRIYPLQEGFYS